jgi:hypothetical protein
MTHYQRAHYTLTIAFSRGIIDGEQLKALLDIYRGNK